LLELAAAVSSAQEQSTGSPKLDMAGVMAALAVAQREGSNSFLYSGQGSWEGQEARATRSSECMAQFLRKEASSPPQADFRPEIPAKPEQAPANLPLGNRSFLHRSKASGALADRKAVFEASSSGSLSCSSGSLPDAGKKSLSYGRKPSGSVGSLSSCSSVGSPDTEKRSVNSVGWTSSQAPAGQERGEMAARDGQQGFTARKLSERKAMFETQASKHGVRNMPVATVFEKKPLKEEKREETISIPVLHQKTPWNPAQVTLKELAQDNREEPQALPKLLDSEDRQVAQFLSAVTRLAGERQGGLDMGGLLEALGAVEGMQVQEKLQMDTDQGRQGVQASQKVQARQEVQARQKIQASQEVHARQIKDSVDRPKAMGVGLAKTQGVKHESITGGMRCQGGEEEEEEVRETWQQALRGARRPGGVRSEGGTVLAQPALATLTPPPPVVGAPSPPPLPPRDSPPLPILPPPTLQRPSQMKPLAHTPSTTAQKAPFGPEKSSVIGELKNVFKDTTNQAPARGYKMPQPDLVDASNPQDPAVKRIVYSQYREMLKSYRTAQT
jgi:hypothetical protein